jgi:hypothetical protein
MEMTMIRDTVMNSDDFDPLTDLLIGEAVLSLLKSKGPISQQALIGKLQAMQAGEMDSKRRNALGRIIDEISNRVARRSKKITLGTSGAKNNWAEQNALLGSPPRPGTNKIH